MSKQTPDVDSGWLRLREYRIDVLHGVIESQRRRIQELEEKAAKVLAWLGPCDHYDHNGNCQSHGVANPCEVAILREAVERKAI